MSDTDLSGRWIGIFNYSHSYPPTRFDATIRDVANAITGTIEEVDQTGQGDALTATIDGLKDGPGLRFTKFYDADVAGYDVVLYTGTANAEGTEINGRWSIPGVWEGCIIMTREPGKTANATRRASAPVE